MYGHMDAEATMGSVPHGTIKGRLKKGDNIGNEVIDVKVGLDAMGKDISYHENF